VVGVRDVMQIQRGTVRKLLHWACRSACQKKWFISRY